MRPRYAGRSGPMGHRASEPTIVERAPNWPGAPCPACYPRHNGQVAHAVFDLDGTLVNGDSTTHWLLDRFRRSPVRLLGAFLALPVAPLLANRRARKYAGSVFFWIASVGLSEPELHASLADFGQRMRAGQLWLRLYPAGLQTFQQHLHDGQQVVIATAAPAWLAEALFAPFAQRIGIVGSRLRRCAGGYVFARHTYGEEKCRALRERGYPERWQYTYTDSLADRPLLERAERGFFINPSARTWKRVRAARLADVLRW
jgi:phosphatidylglycerophosphatase C